MANTHVVVKAFDADRSLARGEKVDARGWLNVKALEEQGFIQRLDGVARDTGTGETNAMLSEVLDRLAKLERAVKAFTGSPAAVEPSAPVVGDALASAEPGEVVPVALTPGATAALAPAPVQRKTQGVRPRRRKAARRRRKAGPAAEAAPASPVDTAAKE